MDSRLKECLEALGKNANITKEGVDAELVLEKLSRQFALAAWGRIDWKKIKSKQPVSPEVEHCLGIENGRAISLNEVYRKKLIGSEENLISVLSANGKSNFDDVYIIWFDAKMPIVRCNLKTIIENLYDVVTVSSDTWLYCPAEGWIVEIDHNDKATIGFSESHA